MLHMITCWMVAPLWDACFNFSNTLLITNLTSGEITRAIIFNMDAGGKVLGETAAAFMRHALSAYYTAATKVGADKRIFDWRATYYFALCSFRDAVLRWAMSIRAHNTKRRNTNLVDVVSEDTLTKHATLVTIKKGCDSFTLTQAFQKAIATAKTDMEAHAEEKKETKKRAATERARAKRSAQRTENQNPPPQGGGAPPN